MGAIVNITSRFSRSEVALIQRMNPDCNADEFNQFMYVAASLGLDPLKKQIYAFVFNKDKPDKRRMSIIIGIDGFRAVANRSGNYRPDDKAPRIVYDETARNPLTNPLGIVSAEVTVYKRVHGDWWPTVGIAFWDEFAPIVEGGKWVTDEETGRKSFKKNGVTTLDPSKDNWRKMARVMISKCAEAQAIRRAWPEDLSSVYEDSELDRAKTLDLTATEIAEAAKVEQRLALVGGADGIMFDLGNGLERVPLGSAADTIIATLDKMPLADALAFGNVNRVPLREFWARSKTDAMAVKKKLEEIQNKAVAEEQAASKK